MKRPNAIAVKYVDLIGQINLGGVSTRNLDAERDLCALHLHQETGGVFVTRGDDEFYIGPSAISSVQIAKVNYEGHKPTPSVQTTQVPAAMLAPLPEDVAKGARNLADSVLSELRDGETDEGTRGARKSQRRVKN